MSVNPHTRYSSSAGTPRIEFAHNPSKRLLKFLDFSKSKARVVVDSGGGLPQTEVSLSSGTRCSAFCDDYGDGHYTTTSYSSTLETPGEAPPAPGKAIEV
jgi:hypothetical protein